MWGYVLVSSSTPRPEPPCSHPHREGPVDFQLDIRATADELRPRADEKLRERRKTMSMKGFRPGKAPLSLVRKMFGEAADGQAAEELVGEAFKAEVTENDAYDVLGQPRLTEFHYHGEDIHAVVQFSRAPTSSSPTSPAASSPSSRARSPTRSWPPSSTRCSTSTRPRRTPRTARRSRAHVAVFDIQKMNRESGETIEGDRQEDARAPVKALLPDFQAATLGKKVGDTFQVELPSEAEGETDPFHVEVKAVRLRTLSTLDAEFIGIATGGQAEDEDGLRTWVRGRMEESWAARTREFMEAKAVQHVLDAHDFPVPDALVQSLIDQAIEEKRDEDGRPSRGVRHRGVPRRAPPDRHRPGQVDVRRGKIVEADEIKLGEEDFDAEIARLFGDQLDPQMAKQFIMQQEGMVEQIAQRLENKRLFDALFGRMTIVEKTAALTWKPRPPNARPIRPRSSSSNPRPPPKPSRRLTRRRSLSAPSCPVQKRRVS